MTVSQADTFKSEYRFCMAAITKYLTLGTLNNRIIVPHASRGQTSEVRV